MIFDCLHRLRKCVQDENHCIKVKAVLYEEMQIVCGKRKMLNGTPYDISGQYCSTNTRADIKLFLHMQDISNHTIKTSKDKLLMDSKCLVVPGVTMTS